MLGSWDMSQCAPRRLCWPHKPLVGKFLPISFLRSFGSHNSNRFFLESRDSTSYTQMHIQMYRYVAGAWMHRGIGVQINHSIFTFKKERRSAPHDMKEKEKIKWEVSLYLCTPYQLERRKRTGERKSICAWTSIHRPIYGVNLSLSLSKCRSWISYSGQQKKVTKQNLFHWHT